MMQSTAQSILNLTIINKLTPRSQLEIDHIQQYFSNIIHCYNKDNLPSYLLKPYRNA